MKFRYFREEQKWVKNETKWGVFLSEKTIRERAKYEKNKIVRLLKAAGVAERTIKLLQPAIQNTATLKAKLDDIQEEIQDADLLIEYDHGGGQSGLKENPIFRMYESMWKSYTAGMKMILGYVPEESAKSASKDDESKNVLLMVRNKHVKKA